MTTAAFASIYRNGYFAPQSAEGLGGFNFTTSLDMIPATVTHRGSTGSSESEYYK